MKRAPLFVFLVLLGTVAAPTTVAEDAFSAVLSSSGPIEMTGEASARLTSPALHLRTSETTEMETLLLDSSTLRITRVYEEAILVKAPDGEMQLVRHRKFDTYYENHSFVDAQVKTTQADEGGQLLLFPSSTEDAYAATAHPVELQERLNLVKDAKVVRPLNESEGAVHVGGRTPVEFEYTYPGDAFHVSAPFDVTAEGDFSVYLWGVDFTVTDEHGKRHHFRTGVYEEPSEDGVTYTQRLEYAILRVTGGVAEIRPEGAPVSAYARDLTLDLAGSLTLHDVSGKLNVGDLAYTAEAAPEVTLDGDFALAPTIQPGNGGDEAPVVRLAVDGLLHDANLEPLTVSTAGAVPSPSASPSRGFFIPVALAVVAAAGVGAGAAVAWRRGWLPRPPGRDRRAEAGGPGGGDDPDLLMATNLLARERFEDAAQWFARYLKRNPGDASATMAHGTCLLHNGDVEGALACFLRTAELSPRDESVNYMVAHTAARLGRAEKALAWLARTHSLAPDIALRSREDPAFEPLWADPRFRALLTMAPPNVDRAPGDDAMMYQ